jgi:hypothetical protein
MTTKPFANLQAVAALHGVALHQIEGDNGQPLYIATRWAMTKQLDTLPEVAAWLSMVTGKKVVA